MASEVVNPTAARLISYTRQDDNPVRNPRISVAVNPPDEAVAKGVIWLDENTVHAQIDEAGILALLNEELTDYAAHRASAVFHNPADTINVVDPTAVTAIAVAVTRANLLKAALLAHFANTGGSFHDFVDDVRGPLLTAVPNATDVQSLRTLVIAIKTHYNAHRNGNDSGANQIHPTNDTTNVVTTADPAVTSIQGPLDIEISDVQVFTTPGAFTWTKPTTFTPKWFLILIKGGGGGSGSGARRAGGVDTSGGAGGGAGGFTRRWVRAASLPSASYGGTTGAGGSGGSAIAVDDTNGNNGSNGSASIFGNIFQALGGGGGQGGKTTTSNGGAGGGGDIFGGNGADGAVGAAGVAGGTVAGGGGGGSGGGISSAGPTAFSGGNGGVNAGLFGAAAAGGGIGAAGVAGNNGPDGPGNGGGGGGSATAAAAGMGGDGGLFGGGAGGGGSSVNGFNSGAGADGADGYVMVISVP